MASNFNNKNDPWEYSLDIDDSDLHLTHVLRSSSSARVGPSPYTPNPVIIIHGHAGIVQLFSSTCVEPSSSTPNTARIIPGSAGTIPGTVHHKFIGDGGNGNDITVRAAMTLANVSIFTPKPSEHYLNITKRNMVKKPAVPPISSYPTVEGSVEEHDTCDEYLAKGFLTEKEQQQLAQDEEAYREYLEEEAKAEKER
nr:hypothetical protein [Tanacetum cinerariifolium]